MTKYILAVKTDTADKNLIFEFASPKELQQVVDVLKALDISYATSEAETTLFDNH